MRLTLPARAAHVLVAGALAVLAGEALAQQRPPAQRQQPPAANANQPLQPVAPPVIAVIDVSAVMRDSAPVRTIREQIEAKRAAYQDEISKRERELRAAEQELAKQRQSLPADQFTKKRQEFEQRVAVVQKDVQAKKRQLDAGFSQAMQQVRETLIQIVAELANETKATLVINNQMVVIVEKSLDISRPALDRLNQRLPRVTVNLPPLK